MTVNINHFTGIYITRIYIFLKINQFNKKRREKRETSLYDTWTREGIKRNKGAVKINKSIKR